jgi:hypothetical protein
VLGQVGRDRERRADAVVEVDNRLVLSGAGDDVDDDVGWPVGRDAPKAK